MFRVQHYRLLSCLPKQFVRESRRRPLWRTRAFHSDVIKKRTFGGKKVFKAGILTGAALVGGIFVKLHGATSSLDEDSSEHSEDDLDRRQVWPNRNAQNTISLSEAITQCRDIIQRKKDETGSPGVVIAVSVNGKDVWIEGFGYSDVENRVKCSSKTIFRIASISKSITMAAVAKLWENGDLDLDKPVQFYVPEFPEKTWEGEKVTITTRQLLSHLGGIRHYDKDYMTKQLNLKGSSGQSDKKSSSSREETESANNSTKTNANETKDEMKLSEYYIKQHYDTVLESLELFKDDPLVHKPGSKFLYTTYGWTLISAVVERASKMQFEQFMKAVLDELGMENTYLDEHSPLIYNRGRHYVKNKKGRLENAPYVDLSYKWAGGGLLSNVLDLTKFGNAMLYSYQARDYSSQSSSVKRMNLKTKTEAGSNSAMQGNDQQTTHLPGYLKQDTMKMIWTPAADPGPKWEGVTGGQYALGWSVWTDEKEYEFCKERKFFVSHTGGAIGASSVLLVFPRDNANTRNDLGKLKDNSRETDEMAVSVVSSPPNGVVIAIVTNMTSVGLNKTAYDIARIFDRVEITR